MSIVRNFSYEPWRHGGWYVLDVQYPSGAVGCVSRNYSDRKWRIVCENTGPGVEGDRTFPSRDAAAQAEWELVQVEWAKVRISINYPIYRRVAESLPPDLRKEVGRWAHTDVTLRVACLDAA